MNLGLSLSDTVVFGSVFEHNSLACPKQWQFPLCHSAEYMLRAICEPAQFAKCTVQFA